MGNFQLPGPLGARPSTPTSSAGTTPEPSVTRPGPQGTSGEPSKLHEEGFSWGAVLDLVDLHHFEL